MSNKNLNKSLGHFISIMAEAHGKQLDRGGKSYALHPLRLVISLQVESIETQIAALFHDGIEDTHLTLKFLREQGVPEESLEAIRLLTHISGVSYVDYIIALSKNTIACKVKLADLSDNSNIDRLPKMTEKDFIRANKYNWAKAFLTGKISEEMYRNVSFLLKV